MKFSKIALKLREKIVRFSGELCKETDKTVRRFVTESVYGILHSQSVILTEIGRSLENDVSVKKIEERFCRHLGKRKIWRNIHENLLTHASTIIKDNTLLIMDLSDIQKKHAKKMEYIADVRDGSEGVIGKGYWTCHIIGAELDSNEIIPLYQSLYSQRSPEFLSENDEILEAINLVSSHLQRRGIYVIDRGADRRIIFESLLKEELRFIIRLEGSRHLIYDNKRIEALELANTCECPYKETIVKMEDYREKVYHLRYGFKSVKLPDLEYSLWMLVVNGFGEKPLMLLTTEPLKRNRIVLRNILNSYLKRWSIESTIRFIKQTYDLENIRLLRYVGLKNMMAILLIAFYFLAVVLDTNQKLKIMTGHVLKSAKRVFGIPDFKYYALGDGLSKIFQQTPGKIWKKYKKNPSTQIFIGFT